MMEFFYYGSEFINTFVKACATFRLACAFPPCRKEKGCPAAALSAALIPAFLELLCGFYFKPDLFSHAAFIGNAFMAGILSAFLYTDCRKTAFCSAFSLWALLSLLDLFLMSLCSIFIESFGISPDILTARNACRGLYLLLFAAFLFWNLKIIHKHPACSASLQNLYKKHLENMYIPAMLPLALCVIYFQRVYKRLIAERLVISWMAFFFAGAVIFALWTLQKERARDKMLHLKFQMLEDNYQSLLKAQKEKAALLHDIKNHMSALHDMIMEGQNHAALDYVQQICGELSRGQSRVWTNHPILDLILNRKLQDARRGSIRVELECDDMSGLILQPADICALFSNILDNAIESNLRQDKPSSRWLYFSCKRQKRMAVIVLNNPVKIEISQKNGIPETEKTDKENHGYGIYSVQKVLDHYGGRMNFRTEDGCFKLTIGLVGFSENMKSATVKNSQHIFLENDI